MSAFWFNLTKTNRGKKTLKIILPIILTYILLKITMKFPIISEYIYARGISRFLTVIVQNLTSIFPFSLMEIIFILIGVVLTTVIIAAFISNVDIPDLKIYTFLYKFVIVATIFVLGYNVTATSLYKRDSVAKPLGLVLAKPTQDDMIAATNFYLDNLIDLDKNINRQENGDIEIYYSFSELNKLIGKEYERLYGSGYFIKNDIKLKKVMLSKLMTYTGITGMYVGVIGEGSINTNVPAYTLATTMAHEMAHSKGVMQENEANVTAYYLCVTSQDDFLRYSGNMHAFAVCLSKIENVEIKNEIRSKIPANVYDEYLRSYEFYDKYEGLVEKVANFFNNLNLKSAGVSEGTLSYSLTDLYLVALYKQQNS